MFRVVLPPDADRPDNVQEILTEMREKVPDLLAAYDPSRGRVMHRTDSVNVLMVASGEPILVLETGRTHLRPGDWVVQQGTWHAWHNPGVEPAAPLVEYPATHPHRSRPGPRSPAATRILEER